MIEQVVWKSNEHINGIIDAGKSHLKRLRDADLSTAFLELPLDPTFSETKRRRFITEDQKLPLIRREDPKQQIWNLISLRANALQKAPAVFITGPQGVGKSYSLYEVVCRLRSDQSNRVIYISDCAGWASFKPPTRFLIETVLFAFCQDPDVIEEWTSIKDDPDSILSSLRGLSNYCLKNSLNLYAIFDQHNGLTDTQRKLFPFSIIETELPTYWNANPKAFVIIAASSNNTYFLKMASNSTWPKLELTLPFNDDEFALFAKKYLKNFKMDDLRAWTDLMPHELNLIRLKARESPGATLQQIYEAYSSERKSEFVALHTEFCKGKDPHSLTAIRLASVYLELGVPATGYLLLDKVLMFQDKSRRVFAVAPLAKEAIIETWKVDWREEMCISLSTVTKSPDWTNDSKGRAVEYYILNVFSSGNFTLHYRSIQALEKNSGDLSKVTEQQIKFGVLTVIKFRPGRTLEVKWNECDLLLIPTASNYKDVDALLWSKEKKILLPLQITILNPIKKHCSKTGGVNEFFSMGTTRNQNEEWKARIKNIVGHDPIIHFVWIGNNVNYDSSWSKDGNQFIAQFSDLTKNSDNFSLLNDLRLQ